MYEQVVEFEFDAAHCLRGYQGKCAQLHGHRYRLQVAIRGHQLDDLGMLIDFRAVKERCREVLADFDHAYLNDVAPFDTLNPTCENLARVLYERLSRALDEDRIRVDRVTVWETPTSAVTYRPGGAP